MLLATGGSLKQKHQTRLRVHNSTVQTYRLVLLFGWWQLRWAEVRYSMKTALAFGQVEPFLMVCPPPYQRVPFDADLSRTHPIKRVKQLAAQVL